MLTMASMPLRGIQGKKVHSVSQTLVLFSLCNELDKLTEHNKELN